MQAGDEAVEFAAGWETTIDAPMMSCTRESAYGRRDCCLAAGLHCLSALLAVESNLCF